MRGIKNIFLLFLIGAGVFYLIQGIPQQGQTGLDTEEINTPKEIDLESKPTPKQVNPISGLEGELFQWIGKSIEELETQLGEPQRKDISSYGYTWWVYKNKTNQYIQMGVLDGEIVTVFATGNNLSTEPVVIGQPYQEINKDFTFKEEVSFSEGVTTYRFKLTESDRKMRPLVQIDPNTFVQFYFDTFTKELSSIRVLTKEILLMQRPYEIFYRGDLPEPPLLSEAEWKKVEEGMEQQIFDITNVIRSRFDKGTLAWDDPVSQVAFGHSKDMAENNYFSHYTLEGEGLKERLGENDIFYFSAGENIAAQYTDAPAVVEGWLNSEGHREALLKSDYTHLGVGVYRYYYTQNFLQKAEGF